MKAIVALARSVGLEVVAEGIETDRQWLALRDNHCDLLQGYLFGRPRPAQEIRALLRESGRTGEAVELDAVSSF